MLPSSGSTLARIDLGVSMPSMNPRLTMVAFRDKADKLIAKISSSMGPNATHSLQLKPNEIIISARIIVDANSPATIQFMLAEFNVLDKQR